MPGLPISLRQRTLPLLLAVMMAMLALGPVSPVTILNMQRDAAERAAMVDVDVDSDDELQQLLQQIQQIQEEDDWHAHGPASPQFHAVGCALQPHSQFSGPSDDMAPSLSRPPRAAQA